MKKEKKQKNFLDKPFYEGGNKALRSFVDQHLVYPETVIKEGLSGTVVVRYTINHKGDVIATKVISGLNPECDEAAQDVVKKLKFQVGSYRNIKVQFHKTIRIHFQPANAIKKQRDATKTQNPSTVRYAVVPAQSSPKKSSEKKSTSYTYTINFQ